jgi:hypothetical protein
MSFAKSVQAALSYPVSLGRFLHRRHGATIDRETKSLPPRIRDLVREVCRRTRLWRREQADVARELAGHFLDGIEIHKTDAANEPEIEDRLITEFGPPKQSAKLIRRAKIRCRPLWWRFQRRVRHAMIAMFCLLLGYAGWILTGEPKVRVDYLAQWNSKHADVPMEDRAWPLHERAIDRYRLPPEELSYQSSEMSRPVPDWDKVRNVSSSNPALVEWVRSNEEALDLFVAASKRPHYGRDYEFTEPGADESVPKDNPLWSSPDEPQPLISVPLWHLSRIRELSIAASARARIRAGEGNFSGGWDDLTAEIRTANLFVHQGMSLIEHLVGCGNVSLANETARLILRETEPTDLDFAASAHAWASALPDAMTNENWLQGEEDFVHDTIQRVFTENWWGNGHLMADRVGVVTGTHDGGATLETVALAMVHADRADTVRMIDRYLTIARRDRTRPLYDPQHGKSKAFVKSLSSGEVPGEISYRYRYALLETFFGGYTRAGANMRLAHADHEATLVCLALQAYRRDHGNYPESLGALPPRYIASIPEDPYDGKPMKYRRTDTGDDFVLYSIASDFKDDGSAVENRWESCESPPKPVDYLFWPPQD